MKHCRAQHAKGQHVKGKTKGQHAKGQHAKGKTKGQHAKGKGKSKGSIANAACAAQPQKKRRSNWDTSISWGSIANAGCAEAPQTENSWQKFARECDESDKRHEQHATTRSKWCNNAGAPQHAKGGQRSCTRNARAAQHANRVKRTCSKNARASQHATRVKGCWSKNPTAAKHAKRVKGSVTKNTGADQQTESARTSRSSQDSQGAEQPAVEARDAQVRLTQNLAFLTCGPEWKLVTKRERIDFKHLVDELLDLGCGMIAVAFAHQVNLVKVGESLRRHIRKFYFLELGVIRHASNSLCIWLPAFGKHITSQIISHQEDLSMPNPPMVAHLFDTDAGNVLVIPTVWPPMEPWSLETMFPVTERCAEQPIILSLCAAYEEHKQSVEYKRAVLLSEQRSNNQVRLREDLWWAEYYLHLGKHLSFRVRAKQLIFLDLPPWKQELAENYEKGILGAEVARLHKERSDEIGALRYAGAAASVCARLSLPESSADAPQTRKETQTRKDEEGDSDSDSDAEGITAHENHHNRAEGDSDSDAEGD